MDCSKFWDMVVGVSDLRGLATFLVVFLLNIMSRPMKELVCILSQTWRFYEMVVSLFILFMISCLSFLCPVSISPYCALNKPQPTSSTVLISQGRLLLPHYCCPFLTTLATPNQCYTLVDWAAPAGLYRLIMFPELVSLFWGRYLIKKNVFFKVSLEESHASLQCPSSCLVFKSDIRAAQQ